MIIGKNLCLIFMILELRMFTGKKYPKIKLQRLRKKRIWTLRSLVHQINSFLRGSETETNFSKK